MNFNSYLFAIKQTIRLCLTTLIPSSFIFILILVSLHFFWCNLGSPAITESEVIKKCILPWPNCSGRAPDTSGDRWGWGGRGAWPAATPRSAGWWRGRCLAAGLDANVQHEHWTSFYIHLCTSKSTHDASSLCSWISSTLSYSIQQHKIRCDVLNIRWTELYWETELIACQ